MKKTVIASMAILPWLIVFVLFFGVKEASDTSFLFRSVKERFVAAFQSWPFGLLTLSTHGSLSISQLSLLILYKILHLVMTIKDFIG